MLSQLGLKIQHALRAFTAKDRKAMKLVAQNFPSSTYYQAEQLLTALGIGEALASALDGKGQPTPLIQCMMRAPESRMGILTDQELANIVASSTLYSHYSQRQEQRSAKDILAAQKSEAAPSSETHAPSQKQSNEPSMITQVTKNTLFRQIVRQLIRDMTCAVMSAFNKKR